MASKRNGVAPREWKKHFSNEDKRAHNKDVRRAATTEVEQEYMECGACGELDLPVDGGECESCHTPWF